MFSISTVWGKLSFTLIDKLIKDKFLKAEMNVISLVVLLAISLSAMFGEAWAYDTANDKMYFSRYVSVIIIIRKIF